ncbi:MAG: hypothetical protein K9J16_06860 [Melioribacteraceae bacterium]|nr:hypothetical protein [Melioribacteraceae bacterium]MCF8354513.1 hypothetical protein [Melioribacteraceae bacterium]MCF8394282.1 hypothetical protein [Melioribacteraceae bacterium]MCF8418182.1 hypothetical protein [Melioribacteraceae bacterium]
MNSKWIISALEITRWITVIIGFQLAYFMGNNDIQRIHILMPWIVISLSGLTGIESLFFGKSASEVTGYVYSAYQRQSGLNNVSVAITAVLVLILGWGTLAEITILCASLIFLFLSSINHFWSFLKEGNKNIKNQLRPLMTLLLIIFILPLIIGALEQIQK